MSEIKVNTIKPAAGSQVTVSAQVLGVPGTQPNHFATVSQLGGGGAGGISRAEAQSLVDTGVASAKIYSDDKDEEQNTQIALDIATAKSEAITQANNYTDSKVGQNGTTIEIVAKSAASTTLTLQLGVGVWFVEAFGYMHVAQQYATILTLQRDGKSDTVMHTGWGPGTDFEGTDTIFGMGFTNIDVSDSDVDSTTGIETVTIQLSCSGGFIAGSERLYAKAIKTV